MRRCAASLPNRCGSEGSFLSATPRISRRLPAARRGLNASDVACLSRALIEQYKSGSEAGVDAYAAKAAYRFPESSGFNQKIQAPELHISSAESCGNRAGGEPCRSAVLTAHRRGLLETCRRPTIRFAIPLFRALLRTANLNAHPSSAPRSAPGPMRRIPLPPLSASTCMATNRAGWSDFATDCTGLLDKRCSGCGCECRHTFVHPSGNRRRRGSRPR